MCIEVQLDVKILRKWFFKSCVAVHRCFFFASFLVVHRWYRLTDVDFGVTGYSTDISTSVHQDTGYRIQYRGYMYLILDM